MEKEKNEKSSLSKVWDNIKEIIQIPYDRLTSKPILVDEIDKELDDKFTHWASTKDFFEKVKKVKKSDPVSAATVAVTAWALIVSGAALPLIAFGVGASAVKLANICSRSYNDATLRKLNNMQRELTRLAVMQEGQNKTFKEIVSKNPKLESKLQSVLNRHNQALLANMSDKKFNRSIEKFENITALVSGISSVASSLHNIKNIKLKTVQNNLKRLGTQFGGIGKGGKGIYKMVKNTNRDFNRKDIEELLTEMQSKLKELTLDVGIGGLKKNFLKKLVWESAITNKALFELNENPKSFHNLSEQFLYKKFKKIVKEKKKELPYDTMAKSTRKSKGNKTLKTLRQIFGLGEERKDKEISSDVRKEVDKVTKEMKKNTKKYKNSSKLLGNFSRCKVRDRTPRL